MIKYFSEEKLFWTKNENRIDIFILMVVSVIIVIDLIEGEETHHKDTIIGAALMILRYGVQLYRVGWLIKVGSEIHSQNQNCKIEIKEEVES